MIPDLDLADDGTMDTVFRCSDCGEDVRYSSEGIERDDLTGDLAEDELERVREEHADECRSLVAYLAAHARVELLAELDDISVRGNALANGDDAVDKECEDAILARLDDGDVWAWALVRVRATLQGWEGTDSIGGCSYADEADFRAGPYYADLRETALRSLAESMENDRDTLAELFAEIEGGAA